MRASKVISFVLAVSTMVYAQGNTWNRVRYNGGTIQTKVDFKDWNNKLSVSSDIIQLQLKGGQSVEIPTNSVTGLSYGQEAHRRVGTMIALGILVAPLALFGLFHKTRLHFIGIEYTTAERKHAGLLLQGDKNNYRGILMALKSATGAPLTVAAEDRKYVPTGIQANVVRGEEEQASDARPTPQSAKKEIGAKVAVNSAPPAPAKDTVTTQPSPESSTSVRHENVGNTQTEKKTANADTPHPVTVPPTDAPSVQNHGGYLGATSTDSPRVRHNGVTLSAIELNSPAYQAGLQAGDVVITIDGKYIYTVEELSTELQKRSPGTRMAIKYMRGQTFYETYVILGGTTRF